MRKTALIGGSRNQRQLFITLAGFDMTAANLRFKLLPTVLQRVVDSLSINIFDAHRQATFTGRDVSNTAAHQATAQNTDAIQRAGLRFTTGIFFYIGISKKDVP